MQIYTQNSVITQQLTEQIVEENSKWGNSDELYFLGGGIFRDIGKCHILNAEMAAHIVLFNLI